MVPFKRGEHRRLIMTDLLASRLETILPNGRGVWVPMDHSASSFPEQGLLDFDNSVDAVIRRRSRCNSNAEGTYLPSTTPGRHGAASSATHPCPQSMEATVLKTRFWLLLLRGS